MNDTVLLIFLEASILLISKYVQYKLKVGKITDPVLPYTPGLWFFLD